MLTVSPDIKPLGLLEGPHVGSSGCSTGSALWDFLKTLAECVQNREII